MAKSKRKMKAEHKGWRPSESVLPDGIRATDVDRMAQRIQDILTDGYRPDESESALLKQVCLLCRRVIAYEKGDSELNQLNDEITTHQHLLDRLGFRIKRDIVPLNLWITRRIVFQKNGLAKLLKQVEGKQASRGQDGS